MGYFLGSRHNAKSSPNMIPPDSQSGHGDQEGRGREDVSEGHSGLLHLVDHGSLHWGRERMRNRSREGKGVREVTFGKVPFQVSVGL